MGTVLAQTETDGAKSSAKVESVAEIASRIRPSLVKITQAGREGMDGLGSGFVVREDGLIATNLHVIGEARRLQVEMTDGSIHDVTEVTASDSRLDLALLRIAQKGLKPLPLGDSSAVQQGEPVVAMGNPEGLAFSVVEGVISATREIDGTPMLQVAVPIEQGNSGGPLLNRSGEVLGLVTLKSIRTDNLGFAMPVNELKRLIEKPNPVPMARWLTIGVLNPRLWQPLLGARWTQRAGVIRAETPGTGFGGRSLCLWTHEAPDGTYEVQVNVKMEDEGGAAGLVFCSDGGDVHYGFYPSAGKLRLTRFEGPDVYSWNILADVASEAYRAGEWNQLRVRIEPEKLVCFVNGRQVLEQVDAALRGGKVGLCKFRNTVAEFRGFRLGKDLAETPVDPKLALQVRQVLDGYLADASQKDKALDSLLADPALSRRVLVEQRRTMERALGNLRDLEKELHRQNMTRELLAELSKAEDKVDLIRCALLLSRHDNPEVDVGQYLQGFQRMVDELKNDPEIQKGTTAAVARLNRFLFEENGFHGSRHDFNSRSNSYINEVLDDREGLPITLAVVYMELAARLGVKGVFGVPLPGKFMVGFQEGPEGELQLVDVFERGRELSVEEAALEVSDTGELHGDLLKPAAKRTIILRMLRNLLGNTLDDETAIRDSVSYLNLLLAMEPDAAAERVSRARLLERLGEKSRAGKDVSWLMQNFPENGPPEMYERLNQWLRMLEGGEP